MEVLGNMGRSVSLPCNTTSSPGRTVTLVMWFKGVAEDPIYSLDMRHVQVRCLIELQTMVPERRLRKGFTIAEKAPTRTLFWSEALTTLEGPFSVIVELRVIFANVRFV